MRFSATPGALFGLERARATRHGPLCSAADSILTFLLDSHFAPCRLITCIPHSSALRRIMCESRPGWCIAGTQSEEKDTNQPYHLRSCWLILGKNGMIALKRIALICVLLVLAGLVGCSSSSTHIAYVTLPTSNSIAAFRVSNHSGKFTPVVGSPFAAGNSPNSIVLDPAINLLMPPIKPEMIFHCSRSTIVREALRRSRR